MALRKGAVDTLALILALVTLAICPSTQTPLATVDLSTNEIVLQDENQAKFMDTPLCRAGSACGYVEVNAFGVNSEAFCRCPHDASGCSLHWDPQDGLSLTMGSKQYKFCGSPPLMHVCNKDEVSYSSALVFDKSTFEMVEQLHRFACFCPLPRQNLPAPSVEDSVEDDFAIIVPHTCSQLPLCDVETPCKEVSMSKTSRLVYVKCRCPRAMACPTFSHVISPYANSYPSGDAYSVFCQPLRHG